MPDEQKPPAPSTSPSAKSPDASKKSAPMLSPDAISRKESKAAQIFRSFLRWAGVALLVFGLGALTTIFLFYVPKSNELKQEKQELSTANATISELQSKITSLGNQISELSKLEETNQTIQDELDQAQLHVQLLDALTDIRAAQYFLEKGDSDRTSAELASTSATLKEMQSLLDVGQADAIDSLISRLELVLGELEANPFAAQSDLEVLVNGLVQLEQTTFKQP